jgi:hypothetical protein
LITCEERSEGKNGQCCEGRGRKEREKTNGFSSNTGVARLDVTVRVVDVLLWTSR